MPMIPESSSFSMSVDRGDDGPIVVSVQGALEIPGNTRLLADCLAGSVLADRPVVVDLVGVTEIGDAATEYIVDAAHRLLCRGYRLTVVLATSAADRNVRRLSERVHVERAGSLGQVVFASTTPWRPRVAAVDALQGTYL
ncbi:MULTISPECIES: hypothetical protein [unclassified Rhodococcus (in: high G+C Gram-positive bacteria)]|uniref:hypothetical protein n=2 Tax=unclassified Rhodococcus (in: high G+C Gram-positive bacteria) TaxID=192944 RepID=UPI00114034C2|nr:MULTISPECIES: hypothetical protein [unclassified Rhodococcus (in: high G+C Gram-positive bacteria)]